MIELEHIAWKTGDRVILDDVTLSIPSGAYAVMMGRTGCGKTTLLEILCGLRHPQKGRVRLEDRDVTDLEPRERGIGYVPQDLALFPGLRVREQIAFALKLRGKPSEAEAGEEDPRASVARRWFQRHIVADVRMSCKVSLGSRLFLFERDHTPRTISL